jgi:DNA-binding transcriptional LysR family regulator
MSTAQGFEEFVTIVERGSLTAAAQELGIPRPTLSRRLAKLEGRLGVRLVRRTTRRLTLTAQGESLYVKARQVVATARQAEDDVRRQDGVPRGLLRVSTPMAMPGELVARWASDFLLANPQVKLELVASGAHVDLVEEGFDLAMRAGPIEDPTLITRTLANLRLIAVASPGYLARAGTPSSLDDLAEHNCIVGYRAGRVPEPQWPLLSGGTVRVSGTLISNDMLVRQHAALRDLGVAMITDRLIRSMLQDGRLVHVLPDLLGRREHVALVYPDREFLDPKVRAFVDMMVARFEEMRWTSGHPLNG